MRWFFTSIKMQCHRNTLSYLHIIDVQGRMTSSLELKMVCKDWTEEVAEHLLATKTRQPKSYNNKSKSKLWSVCFTSFIGNTFYFAKMEMQQVTSVNCFCVNNFWSNLFAYLFEYVFIIFFLYFKIYIHKMIDDTLFIISFQFTPEC